MTVLILPNSLDSGREENVLATARGKVGHQEFPLGSPCEAMLGFGLLDGIGGFWGWDGGVGVGGFGVRVI